MKPAIVVAGSLNMDFVVQVRQLPAPGETVLGHGFQMLPGGKGANQACAAGKLAGAGLAVRMLGRVGYDVFADHLKASLAAAGVDVSGVHACKVQPTGTAMIGVDATGQNSIIVAGGANQVLSPADLEGHRPAFRNARTALFQLESPLAAVARGLLIAREAGAMTILDPAPAQALPPELLATVDVLTPNESEALLLLGRPAARISVQDARALAVELRKQGPRRVILKLGDQGCFYAGDDQPLHVPAFPVRAVDTTAAGDTFNAALAVALTEGQHWPAALRFANAAAALSVTRSGAQTSAPTRAEVEALLASA